jgi:hypothetical protein
MPQVCPCWLLRGDDLTCGGGGGIRDIAFLTEFLNASWSLHLSKCL